MGTPALQEAESKRRSQRVFREDPSVRFLVSTEAGGEVHALGWDILDLLRDAGFSTARAHVYWSDELGYLGSGNMIFLAVA